MAFIGDNISEHLLSIRTNLYIFLLCSWSLFPFIFHFSRLKFLALFSQISEFSQKIAQSQGKSALLKMISDQMGSFFICSKYTENYSEISVAFKNVISLLTNSRRCVTMIIRLSIIQISKE